MKDEKNNNYLKDQQEEVEVDAIDVEAGCKAAIVDPGGGCTDHDADSLGLAAAAGDHEGTNNKCPDDERTNNALELEEQFDINGTTEGSAQIPSRNKPMISHKDHPNDQKVLSSSLGDDDDDDKTTSVPLAGSSLTDRLKTAAYWAKHEPAAQVSNAFHRREEEIVRRYVKDIDVGMGKKENNDSSFCNTTLEELSDDNTNDENAFQPPQLVRGSRTTTTTLLTSSQVGAFSIDGYGGSSDDDIPNNNHSHRANTTATTEEAGMMANETPPVNARLVQEREEPVLVNAQPAPKGLQALVQNKHFKFLVLGLSVVVLVIVLPIVLVLQQNNNSGATNANNNATTEVMIQVVDTKFDFCGTREMLQSDYRGSVNVTEKGVPCVHWENIFQNGVEYPTPGSESNNFCRNPGKEKQKAWCYTTTNAHAATNAHAGLRTSEWGYCDVPYCEAKEEMDNGGRDQQDCGTGIEKRQSDYRGKLNVSHTGKPCLNWPEDKVTAYPEAGIALHHNYCRNPRGLSKAYCLTNYSGEPRDYEFCDVPYCELQQNLSSAVVVPKPKPNKYGPTPIACQNCSIYECGTPEFAQHDYRGTINVTESGRTCQRWDSSYPHVHQKTSEFYPNAGLEENYCRTPTAKGSRAWCFTTDPDKRWEYCNVPSCGSGASQCGKFHRQQREYRGSINVTESGFQCQRWDSMYPHVHFDTPQMKPEAGLEENFCRNPDPLHNEKAWCYTANPDKRFEYCSVPFCETDDEIEDSMNCARTDKQWDYRGTISTTKSGRRCQNWDDDWPWQHNNKKHKFPLAGLEGNYCRNPSLYSEFSRAWCYTTDPLVEREECEVPYCTTNSSAKLPPQP